MRQLQVVSATKGPDIISADAGAGAAAVSRLRNGLGREVHVVPVGAAITKLLVPDKNNKPVDIVLGFDDVEEYMVRCGGVV